jgi:carbonic anhydrase
MSPVARARSGRLPRAIGALALAGVVLAACGGDAAESAAASEGGATEPVQLPPEVTKEDFDDLETRVLELEVEVANLRAALDETGAGESSTEEPAGEEPAAGEPAADGDPLHWSYSEAGEWGQLAAEYATCGTGTHQSPIDLGAATGEDIPNTLFNYSPVPGTIVVNAHTVEVSAPGAGKIVLDDQLYDFVQFHVHAPSEHTIEGERYPLEIHFVHKNADGDLAVVGILVTEGEPWPAFDDIIVSIPLEQDKPADVVGPVDLNALLPELQAAYRYSGSLTTPPCTEGVNWVVLQGTIHMSAEQIAKFTAALPEPNSRPQQPLNDREVVIDLSAS